MTTFLNGGGPPERSATGIPPYLGAPYGFYRTADGFIAVAMNPVNRLAHLVGVPGYEGCDSSNVLEERDRIREDFARFFTRKPTAEWLRILLAEDVWCAPVQTFEEVARDPQVAANGMLVDYNHPDAGRVRTLGIPVQFEDAPGHIRRPPPRLGEHTDEILREIAGYAPEQIDQLRSLEAVG
jgi:crotonobetainyl-CoA:carnitine CoA-transferase CaiB-like acyl-CoA transferase